MDLFCKHRGETHRKRRADVNRAQWCGISIVNAIAGLTQTCNPSRRRDRIWGNSRGCSAFTPIWNPYSNFSVRIRRCNLHTRMRLAQLGTLLIRSSECVRRNIREHRELRSRGACDHKPRAITEIKKPGQWPGLRFLSDFADYLISPSFFIASCTFGRASTRSRNAPTFDQEVRST
jgi:hypothetical protein